MYGMGRSMNSYAMLQLVVGEYFFFFITKWILILYFKRNFHF